MLAVRTSAPANGPVGNQEVFSASGSVQFRKRAATGAPTAFNYGDETAVLERIELVAPPPGIEVADTRIAGQGRGYIPAMTDWPNRRFRDLHRVDGYRLAPADTQAGRYGVALVFVMNIKTPGRHAVPAVDVTYQIGDTRYRSRIRNAFAVRSYTGPKRVVHCPRTPRPLSGAGARQRRSLAPRAAVSIRRRLTPEACAPHPRKGPGCSHATWTSPPDHRGPTTRSGGNRTTQTASGPGCMSSPD